MVRRHDRGNGQKHRKRNFSSLSAVIKVKPLSVNQAYTGRKRKSCWLKGYSQKVMRELPEGDVPDSGNLTLTIHFGVSNRASDLDNLLKPFIDCLQTRYGFNDKQIYFIKAYKKLVRKGDEYIRWTINRYTGEVDER